MFVSFHLFLHCLLCQDLIVLGTGVTAQWSGALASMEEDPALARSSFQGVFSAPCYCVHACARLCHKFF